MLANFAQWNEYLIDASQRGLLVLATLRQRSLDQAMMSADPDRNVLRFETERVLDGRQFKRPINYYLERILPPEGTLIHPGKRPYIIADPRAGQCAGIGGFKMRSEIGDAVRNGHPTYLLGFRTVPEPGQTYEDILDGQQAFFDWVDQQHPDCLPAASIGNCAAGYPTLITAALYPQSFGPLMVVGSPISFWNGMRGQYPMRYAAGLTGGAWLTDYLADLGNGRFDGAWLVLNFDLLNVDNFLWSKQYDLYRAIDTDQERFLEFEKWWGDYSLMNGEEIGYIVSHFFIGNQLTSGQLAMADGRRVDLRAIPGPIVILGSQADNISPPGQSISWVADLYQDDADLRAQNKTVVYILSDHYGHLAQFVSRAVGEREDESIIDHMACIEMLPSGIYELEVDPPADPSSQPKSRIVRRSLAELKTLGYNTQEENRAFSAVARASAISSALYRNWGAPWVRALCNEALAEGLRALHPLRLDHALFDPNKQPLMAWVAPMAEIAVEQRRPVAKDNPWWQWQQALSEQISAGLRRWQDWHDQWCEQTFWFVWGNPWVQICFGVSADDDPRTVPGDKTAQQREEEARHLTWLDTQFDAEEPHAGLLRAIAYAIGPENLTRGTLFDGFKSIILARLAPSRQIQVPMRQIRTQFELLQLDRDRALAALPALLPTPKAQEQCRNALHKLAAATQAGDVAIRERIDRLLRIPPLLAQPSVTAASARKKPARR